MREKGKRRNKNRYRELVEDCQSYKRNKQLIDEKDSLTFEELPSLKTNETNGDM